MQEIDKKILEFLREIPKGKVATYKSIATRFGVHPRKVALVMKYNKDPITYPCYKVVSQSGNLSGYSADGGIGAKIDKLQNDGIEVMDGKIDSKYFI